MIHQRYCRQRKNLFFVESDINLFYTFLCCYVQDSQQEAGLRPSDFKSSSVQVFLTPLVAVELKRKIGKLANKQMKGK